jgi:hypothetical protein
MREEEETGETTMGDALFRLEWPISAQSLKMNCLLTGGEMANLLQRLVLFLGLVQKID